MIWVKNAISKFRVKIRIFSSAYPFSSINIIIDYRLCKHKVYHRICFIMLYFVKTLPKDINPFFIFKNLTGFLTSILLGCNMTVTIFVVCFIACLFFLGSLYCKHFGPRSDCSHEQSDQVSCCLSP